MPTCACSILGDQKKVLDPLKLELQAVVSWPVLVLGTWVLCKSRKYSATQPSFQLPFNFFETVFYVPQILNSICSQG